MQLFVRLVSLPKAMLSIDSQKNGGKCVACLEELFSFGLFSDYRSMSSSACGIALIGTPDTPLAPCEPLVLRSIN